MGEDVVAVLPEPVKLGEIRARHEKLVADMLAFSIRVLYQPDGQQAHADRAALLAVLTATRRALEEAQAFIEYARYHLEPGLAIIGGQFPKQEDADNVRAQVDAALALATDAP